MQYCILTTDDYSMSPYCKAIMHLAWTQNSRPLTVFPSRIDPGLHSLRSHTNMQISHFQRSVGFAGIVPTEQTSAKTNSHIEQAAGYQNGGKPEAPRTCASAGAHPYLPTALRCKHDPGKGFQSLLISHDPFERISAFISEKRRPSEAHFTVVHHFL